MAVSTWPPLAVLDGLDCSSPARPVQEQELLTGVSLCKLGAEQRAAGHRSLERLIQRLRRRAPGSLHPFHQQLVFQQLVPREVGEVTRRAR